MVDVSGYPEYDVAVSSMNHMIVSHYNPASEPTKSVWPDSVKEALEDIIKLVERLGQDVIK
jgi:hypothetical protein